MRRGRVEARFARVVAHRQEADLRRYAAVLGIPVAELRAEAEEVTRLCRDAGAVTLDACVVLVARNLGVTPEEMWVEIGRLPEALRAAS